MVLFCRIQCLDVPMPVWFSQDALGPPEREHSLKSPSPHSCCLRLIKLFLDRPNALKLSKRMYKEVFLLLVP